MRVRFEISIARLLPASAHGALKAITRRTSRQHNETSHRHQR
jgi:hypothetical protein